MKRVSRKDKFEMRAPRSEPGTPSVDRNRLSMSRSPEAEHDESGMSHSDSQEQWNSMTDLESDGEIVEKRREKKLL